jgi:hypothetical protein
MNPDADANVDQLIELTRKLTQALSADAAAFEARRPHEVAPRMPETARLANLYRHESSRLRRDNTLVRGASAERRTQLRRATETFESTLARHGKALYGVHMVTEGLVKAIAEEVARSRATGAGYGPGARPYAPQATSVTLNQRA